MYYVSPAGVDYTTCHRTTVRLFMTDASYEVMEYITNRFFFFEQIYMAENDSKLCSDGNCLFRSFSFILHNTEEKHLYLSQVIVEAIVLNEECFRPYCLPDIVTEHAEKITMCGEHKLKFLPFQF